MLVRFGVRVCNLKLNGSVPAGASSAQFMAVQFSTPGSRHGKFRPGSMYFWRRKA
jgi:hypothetical protein